MDISIAQFKQRRRPHHFFLQSAEKVARELVGDYLVVNTLQGRLIGKIVETEAYPGIDDDASHSFGRKITKRNKILYEEGGLIYVYMIYGKFYCFNVVVSRHDDPQTVFIRALEPVAGVEIMKKHRGINDLRRLTNGPCRWTMAFAITKQCLGKSICSQKIFIAQKFSRKFEVGVAKRIGIDYAEKSKDLPLRFYLSGNPFVSKQ